jgi:hypothetical protein
MARRDPILNTIEKKGERGLNGNTTVGAKVGRSIGELCIQGHIKGNNDIDHLALHNKRTKSAHGPNTFRKEPNDIMSCYFQNKSPSNAAFKEPKESNVA